MVPFRAAFFFPQNKKKTLPPLHILAPQELEGLSDPMRKDVSQVRKKINAINKELMSLGHTCQKKEKEYRDALEAFNEKNREKVQLMAKLMELVNESEKTKMKKLEELSKNIQSLK
ncbi:uncharacterized protein LOC125469885 [Pyrus x bretschneideri]|uniref:uncharacterized protein LOC125469885 n=1 Tax=Pyrus x bretschneideri TaxID=225117 RepID=UPI0020303373|nr:uncharacterized protein LOC125469885 [Pyrus x bretschneideri]